MSDLNDVYIRRAHFLEQYKNGEVKNFTPFLKRVIKSLRDELLKTQTVTSQSRIASKLAFIESMIRDQLVSFTDEFSGQLNLFAVEEAAFTVAALTQAAETAATIPSTSQLKAAINARPFNNRLLKDYLNEFSKDQAKMIRNAISMGFYEGKSTHEIVNGIVGTKRLSFKDGTLNMTRASAERLVRTAISHTSSVAKSITLQENIDITPYYEWSSTLDGRTSGICRAGDGKVFQVGKGPVAPHHFNCRSLETPLFSDEVNVDSMTKINTTGKDENYNDWLKRQAKSFQVEVLGPTKVKLFRDGGLTMSKFMNNGRELTLDQLKTKYPSAFTKADV